MKKIIIFALLQTVLLCANAQTFHAIVFCNTSDRSIGESMSVELANVSRNLGVLERLLEDDYLFEITRIDGPNCTGANLRQIINAMKWGQTTLCSRSTAVMAPMPRTMLRIHGLSTA